MSYLRYLYLFAYSGVQHIDYMSNMAAVLKEGGTACHLRAPGFTRCFWCGPCCSSF